YADTDHRQQQDKLIVNEVNRKQAQCAAYERDSMDLFPAGRPRERWQQESHDEASDRIDRKSVTAPGLPVSKEGVSFIWRTENVIRRHQAKKHPHAEQ